MTTKVSEATLAELESLRQECINANHLKDQLRAEQELAFAARNTDFGAIGVELERLKRELENTRHVLEAYKAHHKSFHPTCNISGPPNPPKGPKPNEFA